MWQVPSIRLAQGLGYEVLVSDVYAERPGYAIADSHAVVDITDFDATLALARTSGISGIVCDTTDVGVPTMAYVAEELGLPGIGLDTALNFTNKYRMRVKTAGAGIKNPPVELVPSPADAHACADRIGFPCVFKSVDSQSSRGVTIVRQRDDVLAAYEAARSATRSDVIVEGFLRGRELTVEGYCVDGQPVAGCISDKDHYTDIPVAHRLTYPADVTDAQRREIVDTNARVVRALGLTTGVTHAEYMLDGDDVSLVEIAARGGGSHVYSDILPALANRPIPELYLRRVMGEAWTDPGPVAQAPPRAANLAFFRFPPGQVTSIDGVEEARQVGGVARITIELEVGAVAAPVSDDRSRHGFVLVFGPTREDVLATTRAVYDLVRVGIDGIPSDGRP